jgi:TonB family protein
VYPAAAARRHVRGPVVLEFTITPAGVVQGASALSGDRLLVGAAIAAARLWRFQAGYAPVRVLGALNVEPTLVDTAPNISPPPLLPPSIDSSSVPTPRGTPGKARMWLNIGRTGRVIDAVSMGGSKKVLMEALDTALRWQTEPLMVNGVAESYQCRVEWSNFGVVRVGEELPRPECYKVPPEGAASKGIASTTRPARVVVEIVIDARGVVVDARVLGSSPGLGQAALTAVRQWRFGPVFFNGVAVPTIKTVVLPS